jgi:hypothetical protein
MATVAIVLVFAGSFVPLLRVLWRPGGPDDSQSDSDDWGGGNKRREPRGPRDGGGGEPPWWPEFEREFAVHVRGLEVASASER